jgi:hypothetical protein
MKMVSAKSAPLALLSRLLLTQSNSGSTITELETNVLRLDKSQFDGLIDTASKNHVIVRACAVLHAIAASAGGGEKAEWVERAISTERARIENAIPFLAAITHAFEKQEKPIAVIKSLDHWPDLGSDLDLYTDAKPDEVIQLMKSHFQAKIAPRSWGDRLARKWNFIIPGLPELVEIHVGRLGQTGEQSVISSSIMRRTRHTQINGISFQVPSSSDRLIISTLQRMYRHFYFRLCDIIDSASLVENGNVDFADLRAAATGANIWEGVATYLVIVSDYVNNYRGTPLNLPKWVIASARFGGKEIYSGRDFLRVPIMPQSAMLYGAQLAGVLSRGQLNSGARLSLLPWLATAALVGQKITGSDKGIW